MARLVYSVITSLDGYVAAEDGTFDWAAPDEEVHAFVNDRERSIGTYLYGRRMYETMRYWEAPDGLAEQPAVVRDYAAIWQAADKVVYSSSLQQVSSARTRIERVFDPATIAALKAQAPRDVSVGGPHLAAVALRAGLVDEYHAVRHSGRGRRRERSPPGRRAPGPGAAGRTPLRQRSRPPALPRQTLSLELVHPAARAVRGAAAQVLGAPERLRRELGEVHLEVGTRGAG